MIKLKKRVTLGLAWQSILCTYAIPLTLCKRRNKTKKDTGDKSFLQNPYKESEKTQTWLKQFFSIYFLTLW